ncbi:MAG: hypothetical protein JXR33_02980 [Coriobacteriia bacterium]|nr:hypothetical protein [Coriobacteriia bacterium]
MKKSIVFVLVTALALMMAATPALATVPDMEGIDQLEIPAELPQDLEIIELTENETLRTGACCFMPIVRTGPCLVTSCDAPMDMIHNNDELGICFQVPVYVDIVHSLSVGLYDAQGAPKCSFYLGNTSPVEGYEDPQGLNGTDVGFLKVMSNDEYVKSVYTGRGLMPVWCDDAGGRAWEDDTGLATPLPLKVHVDGEDVGNMFISAPHAVPPDCVTTEEIKLSVDKPDWQNEAGMYAGWVMFSVWQI